MQQTQSDSWGDTGDNDSSLRATLPHAQSRRELHTKFKKSSSEPLIGHQATVPLRYTPHPNETAYSRWPQPGWKYGLIDDVKDHKRHTFAFGARQLRFKPLSKEAKEVPEMTLDELRNFLTQKHGSLKRAFDLMDFFRDGQLSVIEWQEGVYNNVADSFGTANHNYRMAIVPRKQFNKRMQHLFTIMDVNKDGLIDFDQLCNPYLEPEESGFEQSRRRAVEVDAHYEEKKVHLQSSMLTGSLRAKGPPEHHREQVDPKALPQPLRDFAIYLVQTFKDVDAGFAAFDVAGNGQLNLAEFKEGARRIKYAGNAEEIFKLLDDLDSGTINQKDLVKLRPLPPSKLSSLNSTQTTMRKVSTSLMDCSLGMSKKEAKMARKIRANIRDPPPHHPGLTLTASDIRRPGFQGTQTASSFYFFPRSATGRLDHVLHPNELPGWDAEGFSPEHGPGFVPKGPENCSYIGMTDHPRRGDGWKLGATINREQKFGLMMPSKTGNIDRECAGMSFLTHEGRRPQDSWRVCNTGGLSWSRSPVRPGITNPLLLHRTR